MVQVMEYGPGSVTPAEIQRSIDEFWAEYERDPAVQQEVDRAGVDLASVDTADRPTLVRARPKGSGLDPATVELIVAFAPAGNYVAFSLWRDVLLPRIKHRRGEDAVGPPRSEGVEGPEEPHQP